MKKLLTIIILILITSSSGFSHGVISIRSKCRPWSKKYRTTAYVWIPVWHSTVSDAECGYTVAQNANMCAFQNAWAGGNGTHPMGFSGAVWNSRYICGRGQVKNSLVNKMGIKSLALVDSLVENSEITSNNILFDNSLNSVFIPNLSGKIKTLSPFTKSEFEIIIWKPEDDTLNFIEDTTILESKILWQGKVILQNGSVSFSGNFDSTQFIKYTYTDSTVIRFDSLNFVIAMPIGVSVDDVAVQMISHGEYTELGIVESFVMSSNEQLEERGIELEVYPNPASKELNITSNIEDMDKFSLSIYNSLGSELVPTLEMSSIYSGGVYRLDLLKYNLPPGVYYILFEQGEKNSFLKKIVLQ